MSDDAGAIISLSESRAIPTTQQKDDVNSSNLISIGSGISKVGDHKNGDDTDGLFQGLPPEIRLMIYRFSFELALPKKGMGCLRSRSVPSSASHCSSLARITKGVHRRVATTYAASPPEQTST